MNNTTLTNTYTRKKKERKTLDIIQTKEGEEKEERREEGGKGREKGRGRGGREIPYGLKNTSCIMA